MQITKWERDNLVRTAKSHPIIMEEEPARTTLADVAARYDVQPTSLTNFRRRHPEVKMWSDEQVARQIAINRNMKVRKLRKYTKPPTLADLAESRGVNKWSQWRKRVQRGADPLEATSPDYKKRSRWDGKRLLKDMCEEEGIHKDSVARWKREHPDHGLSDAEVVKTVKRNKEKRNAHHR